MDILYERIRQRRKELKISQDELACLIGYKGRSAVCKIERGEVDLPTSKLFQVARLLNTTPAWLLGIEPLDSGEARSMQDDAFLAALRSTSPELQQVIRRMLEG